MQDTARIRNRLQHRAVLPHDAYISLLLTLRCNLRCPHCVYFSSPQRAETMSVSDATRAIVVVAAIRPSPRLYFSGGEPTLHPDYRELLEFSLQRDVDTYLATNGRWLGESLEEHRLLALLAQYPTFNVRVSLDRSHLREDPQLAHKLREWFDNGKIREYISSRRVALSLNAPNPEAARRLVREVGVDLDDDGISRMWNVILDPVKPDPAAIDFIVVSPWGRVYRNNATFAARANDQCIGELDSLVQEMRQRLLPRPTCQTDEA